MPQEKKTTKDKTPPVNESVQTLPVSESENLQCHVHDKAGDWQVDDIRENVCRDLETTKHSDGNHYCLFHLPTKEKDIDKKFEQIFQARLKEIEEKLAEIEKLPEDQRELAKRKVSYDFRYVWFPSEVYLRNYKFTADADFSSATFTADANFNEAKFLATANFISATFTADANFSSATFTAKAYFSLATFTADANFNEAKFLATANFISATFTATANFIPATFTANAYFSYATFTADANFNEATFTADASFRLAKFLETSQVFFKQTKICKTIDFQYSVFAGYVAFEGKSGENVFLDKEAVLNLQNARLEKPERISFHRVRLCPGWFVNVDSREMVFTDVRWANLDREFRNRNIDREMESLEKIRKISEPRRLLEIACRQLGVNAEENNLYEDAAKFRYLAMETKRLDNAGWRRFINIHLLYKWSSGYGENWRRAFFILIGVLLISGVFYNSPFAYFEMPEKKKEPVNIIATGVDSQPKPPEYYKMNNSEGFIHSLYIAALQRPEPKSAQDSQLTKAVIILETIFAPLQAALLALAIRWKFMR